MISINSLRVDYENVTAVNDLTVEIPSGQIYGLVGPNGAGKTSTIKALAGLLEPTYGEIKIAGYDLETDREGALSQVGFMPDFSPVYENLKVWEYLEVFSAAYLIPRSERIPRAREWVARVNLNDKWDSYIRELSRGMRQRLVLAKTLLHDPQIILLDEPASGLDPIARLEMRNILKTIAASGKTILISSHILLELSDFCNAVGIMEKGKMVVSGSVDNIRASTGAKKELVIQLADNGGSNADELLSILAGCVSVRQAREVNPGEYHAGFSGEKKEASAVLAELVQKKIPVAQFYIKEANLEDIFFKIGAKEVS